MENHQQSLVLAPARLPSPSCPFSPASQSGSFSSPSPCFSHSLLYRPVPQVSPPLESVSLSLSRDEPVSSIQEAMAVVRDRMHTLRLNGVSEKGIPCEGESGKGEVTTALLEEGNTELKLGKRVYFEHAAGEEAGQQAENSSSSSKSGSSSSRNKGFQRKKHKGSSVAPKCQVEGCHMDLSCSKDYHRRHKVCELHSKASVSNVAGREQRFCQQCSRFQALSEFDEGKRSCRRRLACHNERRRKPPQEPIPLLSAGAFACLADSRFKTLLTENPHPLQKGKITAPKLCLPRLSPEEDVSNYQVSESDHSMQGLPSARGLADAGRAFIASHANRWLLSSASGSSSAIPPAPSSMSLVDNSQPSSEMPFAGCALSLLSSLSDVPNNPCTMSMSIGRTSSPIDQVLVDTHSLLLSHETALSPCLSSAGMGVLSVVNDLGPNLNEGSYVLTNASNGYMVGIGVPQSSVGFEGEINCQTLESGGNQV